MVRSLLAVLALCVAAARLRRAVRRVGHRFLRRRLAHPERRPRLRRAGLRGRAPAGSQDRQRRHGERRGARALRVDAAHARQRDRHDVRRAGQGRHADGQHRQRRDRRSRVLAGGAILALGNARQDNEPRIALARYTSTGVLDAGFGTGGKVIDDLLADGATATAMARAADGSILVTGQIRDGAAQKVFLRRFSAERHARSAAHLHARRHRLRDREPDLRAPGRLDRRDRLAVPLHRDQRRDLRPGRLRPQAHRGRRAARRLRHQRARGLDHPGRALHRRDRRQPGALRALRRRRAGCLRHLLHRDGDRSPDRGRRARPELRRRRRAHGHRRPGHPARDRRRRAGRRAAVDHRVRAGRLEPDPRRLGLGAAQRQRLAGDRVRLRRRRLARRSDRLRADRRTRRPRASR